MSENLSEVLKNMEFSGDADRSLNDKVLIVDGMNTFIRSFAAIPTMDDNGVHVGGVTGFFKSVGYAIRATKPTRVIIVFDGKGGSQKRRETFADYKTNRKPPTRLNRTYDMTTVEEEQEIMKYQLLMLVQLLQHCPFTFIALDNVEADDVMAYCSELVTERGGKSILYSVDKDFLQLVSPSCSIWHPMKKVMYNESRVHAEYGIHPRNFLLYRTIIGDKSDNIPGINGVGHKTILKHFPKFSGTDKYGIEELILDAQGTVGKNTRKIADQSDILYRNIKLMKLTDTNISVHAKMTVLDKFNTDPPPFKKFTLTKMMAEYSILSSMGDINSWMNNTFSYLVRSDG